MAVTDCSQLQAGGSSNNKIVFNDGTSTREPVEDLNARHEGELLDFSPLASEDAPCVRAHIIFKQILNKRLQNYH